MSYENLITCPFCKSEEHHDPFFEPWERKIKSQAEHAVGYRIDWDNFHSLCSNCKEWVVYLGTENKLGDEAKAFLKGGDYGKEKDDVPRVG